MSQTLIVLNDVIKSATGLGVDNGGQFGPVHNTSIQRLANGAEIRIKTQAPTRRYELSRDILTASRFSDFLSFFYQMEGAGRTFLLLDPSDYSTAPDHTTSPIGAEILTVPLNVPAVSGGASPGDRIQIFKNYKYSDLAPTVQRIITKPIPGTVRVVFGSSIPGNVKVEDTDYTVDYTRGQITLLSDPGEDPISIDCQYYVQCRFGQSVDEWMQGSLRSGGGTAGLPNLEIVEVPDMLEGLERLPGGGIQRETISGSRQMGLQSAFTWLIQSILSTDKLILPDPNIHEDNVMDQMPMALGGPYFCIVNEGTENFILESEPGVTLRTVLPGEYYMILLAGSTGSTTRSWFAAK